MPSDFPPWTRAYAFFARWRDTGVVSELHERLHQAVRRAEGREPEPSAAVVDSQSVKADATVAYGSRGRCREEDQRAQAAPAHRHSRTPVGRAGHVGTPVAYDLQTTRFGSGRCLPHRSHAGTVTGCLPREMTKEPAQGRRHVRLLAGYLGRSACQAWGNCRASSTGSGCMLSQTRFMSRPTRAAVSMRSGPKKVMTRLWSTRKVGSRNSR